MWATKPAEPQAICADRSFGRRGRLEEAAARLDIDIGAGYAVSISPAHLAKIERGEKPATDRLVWGLSMVYGVDVRDLFPTKEE